MRYYIIAGEASGDLHGSNLVKAIKRQDTKAEFRGLGGDRMMKNGVDIALHINKMSFMGFIEVVKNLPQILSNFSLCKKDIVAYQPDVVILIDYPGFNLRMAKFIHEKGIRVHYYISPQLWAWKESRITTVKKYVDLMLVILPFEKSFYKKHAFEAEFVGHPLIDAIESEELQSTSWHSFIKDNVLNDKKIISLLPGSRLQEIKQMLPVMLNSAAKFENYQVVIAGVNSVSIEDYQSLAGTNQTIKVVYDQTYDLLRHSHAALVTSGTATLETALLNVPQVVCYKGSAISYQIAKRLVKVKYISLVNLILDQAAVKELIQEDMNESKITEELEQLCDDAVYRQQMMSNYKLLNEQLGGKGASERAAKLIYSSLTKA
jgi:lipid-A-disaccharide synthase